MVHRTTESASAPIGQAAARDAVPQKNAIRIKGGDNFFIIGPVHSFEAHGDGTIVRKTHHQNGVTDVEIERTDGTIATAIETGGPFFREKTDD